MMAIADQCVAVVSYVSPTRGLTCCIYSPFSLIILAYQPTIIYSDLPSLDTEDLAPASKEISASSAKTILDIVIFAELVSLV